MGGLGVCGLVWKVGLMGWVGVSWVDWWVDWWVGGWAGGLGWILIVGVVVFVPQLTYHVYNLVRGRNTSARESLRSATTPPRKN